MRRVGSGTVPPDENFDRLIRTSLQADFAGYAPDPTSALGELRYRTRGSERKRRRILPFLPRLSKTVIAVACVVFVTAAALLVTEIPHLRGPNATQQGVQQAAVKTVATPPELENVTGQRFGPAFQLRGPHGQQVTGVLSYANPLGPNPIGSKLKTSGCGTDNQPTFIHWYLWLTLSGDISMVNDPTFDAVDRESGTQFLRNSVQTGQSATRTQLIAAATLAWAGQSQSANTIVPVDVDITYIGHGGKAQQVHLTPQQGWQFTADTRGQLCP
jgi:hypothetical protein